MSFLDRIRPAKEAEAAGADFVGPEFVEKINQSNHWQHEPMIANQLAEEVDIWS